MTTRCMCSLCTTSMGCRTSSTQHSSMVPESRLHRSMLHSACSACAQDVPNPRLSSIYKIMGRSSVDIIKSGGYKISALEIESVLLQHEAIKECAVIGKPDETWGEKVTAICVLQGTLDIKALRDWGKERLATYT